MKRFLALALTLILAVSLSLPAAAASDDYWNGHYDGTGAGYDAGYADFAAGKEPAYPVDDSYDGGYDSGYAQGYIAGYEDAQWHTAIYESPDYDRGYADGYAAAMAGETGYPDEYWENEAYEYGYDDGYYDGIDDFGSGTSDPLTIADFGGKAGEINVLLNDRCIDFGSVWPEMQNGRVMAPVRTVLEALGAEVSYDAASSLVSARLGGRLLLHTVGTATVEAYPDGDTAAEPEIFTMDCSSYVRGGRTMVPVRFFSEALGCLVEWDGCNRTVVLLDGTALTQYDDQLTVLNLLLSDALNRMAPGETYRQTGKLDLDLTLFDTLNGNRKFAGSAALDALCSDAGLNLSLELELSDLMELLEQEADPYVLQEIEEYLPLLRQLQIDAIYNREQQQLYLHSPLLDAVMGQSAWIQNEVPSLFSSVLLSRDATVSGLVLQNVLSNDFLSPIYYHSTAAASLEELAGMFGDSHFTKSGNTYTLKQDELAEMLGSALEDTLYWEVNDYYGSDWTAELSLQVTDTGNGTCDYTAGLHFRCNILELDLDCGNSGLTDSMTFDLHLRNVFQASLTASATARISNEPVQTEPPTQAVPLDLQKLYS